MFKVLMVDDKEIFLRTIMRMPFFLKNREKVQIVWALNSSLEALEILRREHVDIVMTDIRMPVMSGLDLLKIIQKENLCSCTILISEYTEFSYAREGILYGAFDYIVKPLRDEMIAQTMDRALAHLEKEQNLRQQALEEDGFSAKTLIEAVFSPDEAGFESSLQTLRRTLSERKDTASAVRRVKSILHQMHQIVSAEHAYISGYLPLNELFSLPEKAEFEEEEKAVLYLIRTLRFLRRKASLFHTASENRQVQNIWYYTISNSEEPCRLADTAQRFFLNPSYLSSLFKKETGISYKSFVQDLKMEKARYLLAFSGQKISEIADRLSFSDAEYFRKTFKASTGISPARFNYEDYISRTVE